MSMMNAKHDAKNKKDGKTMNLQPCHTIDELKLERALEIVRTQQGRWLIMGQMVG